MMPEITGPSAAFLAGLVTSLHCAGMCGPLACSACISECGRPSQRAMGIYHLTRLASYTLAGGLVGAIGSGLAVLLTGGATRGITWIFALFFLAVALGWDKRLKWPTPSGRLSRIFSSPSGPRGKSAGLGILTPLLPCAPLYLVLGAAAFSGSALGGASLLLAFGAGTVPLLFFVQNRLGWLQSRWSPTAIDRLRRGLALASVVLLLVRGTYTASTGCPMCQ